MRSKPLPPGLSGPVGISELEPSDSPGGLTHTKASIPVTGLAVGRAPMPAPFWLHQLPLWRRLSTRLSITKVERVVELLGPDGRPAPPQPLREVSTIMPMLDGYASLPLVKAALSAAR